MRTHSETLTEYRITARQIVRRGDRVTFSVGRKHGYCWRDSSGNRHVDTIPGVHEVVAIVESGRGKRRRIELDVVRIEDELRGGSRIVQVAGPNRKWTGSGMFRPYKVRKVIA